MATRKTTTRGKTNTKRAAKTASSKSVSTKTTRQQKVSLSPNLLHKLVVAGNVLLAVLAAVMMAPAVFPITMGYQTSDALLSTDSTVFAPAERVLADVDLRWVLGGLLVFGALYSLLLLTRWRGAYDRALKGRVWFWRWVYLALSSMLMVEIVAVLSGVTDVSIIKLAGALTGVGFALAWLSERQNEKATRKPVASAYLLGLGSVLLPWVTIACYALGTSVYGLVRLPWYVYAAEAAVFLGVVLTYLTLWMENNRSKRFKDYLVAERTYLTLSLLTQVALAVILIVGFAK